MLAFKISKVRKIKKIKFYLKKKIVIGLIKLEVSLKFKNF